MQKMEIHRYTNFTALPDDAKELARIYRQINPFVCDIWLRAYEKFLLKPPESAIYLVVSRDSQTKSVVPLITTKLPSLPARKLHSMANFYTSVFEPLVSPGENFSDSATLFAEYFWQEFRSHPLIEIEPVRDSEMMSGLANSYAKLSGYDVRQYLKSPNYFEVVQNDDYKSYLARRPGNLRSTIKRKRNQLTKQFQCDIDIHTSGEALRRAFPDYELIYAESWKGDESSSAFICSAMSDLANAEKACLGVLKVDGEPAAAQIWLKMKDAWGVFKLAYRPKFKQFSVGTVLTAAMIESFFEAGSVSEIDFFSGDDAYKRDWVCQHREHHGYEFIQSRNILGKLLSVKRRMKML